MKYSDRVHIRKDKTNLRRIAYLTLLLFGRPPEWPLFALGASLIVAGILFHGWAAGYLARAGYVQRETVLTVRGPYRHNRNPYYLAHLTMDLGFCCVAGLPLLYLFYFPAIFFVYRTWVMHEEPFLEEEFGAEYLEMKTEIPRWRPRISRAPARGPEQTFELATFMLNREWPRAMSHVILLTVFGGFIVFENPFGTLDLIVRLTIMAVVVGWLAVRDVQPADTSRKSIGWALLSLGIAGGTATILLQTPVWEVWSSKVSYFGIGAAACSGLIASTSGFRGVSAKASKIADKLFIQPTSHWFIIGLGLGLLSCTLGGVWIGLALPLIAWALSIAGLVRVKALPQNTGTGVTVLLLFAVSGVFAVLRALGLVPGA